MNNLDLKFDNERMIVELKCLPWTKGLSESAIGDIAKIGEYVQLENGDFLHRVGEKLDGVFFIFSGRLLVTVIDLFGNKALERPMIRGYVFGLFSIAEPDHVNINVLAAEPTTGIWIKTGQLLELTSKYTEFQLNLYRLAANLLQQVVLGDRKKNQPSAIGVVHQSAASRPLTAHLVRRLMQIEAKPCVVGDDPGWKEIEGVPFHQLFENGKLINEQQRHSFLKEWADLGRIFIDIDAGHDPEMLHRLLSFADKVLWCVRPDDSGAALRTLRRLQDKVAGWREKICLVWLLDNETSIAPYQPELSNLVERDFKISFSEPAKNQGRLLQSGIERIIHHLRGVQIGIALGGGAARGMAHLGVLKALEQNGIYVDMIAGTSAGAMTGTCYASGMDNDYSIGSFIADLRLPWIFRRLPAGGYWYLLYKYRMGLFDPMLRKYIGDARLEQLQVPMLTVAVDLVSGAPVVRETGDAVRAIIESINLPGLSVPIVHECKALVDGGLINNIPANVLVSKGCNYVIASSVTAKLEPEFVGIRADKLHKKHKSPSILQTLMRGNMVQSFNMNSVGIEPADFVIEPDVTAFDLSEFERADELSAVGERTTSEAIATIKHQLSKLDSQLFPWG